MGVCSYCGYEVDLTTQVCSKCNTPVNLTYPSVGSTHTAITHNFWSRVFLNIFSRQIRREIKENRSLNLESLYVAWFAFLVFGFISALEVIERMRVASMGYYYMPGTLGYVNRNIIFNAVWPYLMVIVFLYLTPLGIIFSRKRQPFSDIFRSISYPASLTILVFSVVIPQFYPYLLLIGPIGVLIIFGFSLTLIQTYATIFDMGLIKAIVLYLVILAISVAFIVTFLYLFRDYLIIPL